MRMTNMKFQALRPLGGAALLALAAGLATPAWAQDKADAEPHTGGLEEIVVTAQHRQENLQDVPIAVTAIGGEALAQGGVGATNTLSQAIPAVQFTRSGPSGLFFLRGVGTTNAAAGEEGANAVYVDGVYMPDLGQTINNFNNVERIEVLKGPQGTLFGRNATGGLIHIITRDPPTDRLTVKAQGGFANYETFSGQAYVGAPISEQAAFDVAVMGQDQGKGWGRNVTLNRDFKTDDHWGVRSKLVARPSDTVKLTFAGDYYTITDTTALGYNIEKGTVGTGGVVATSHQNTQINDPARTRLKIWGVSAKGEVDLGFAQLTSITAYRKNNNRSALDVDGGPNPVLSITYESGSKAFQQEVRLASSDTEPLAWQVGAFYLNTRANNNQPQRGTLCGSTIGSNILADLKSNSYAAFAEVTYAVTPTTHVTGGVRYTKDERDFAGTSTRVSNGAVSSATIPRLRYDAVTWRASIRQDVTDDVNVYASFNRGFKSGSYSLQAPTNAPYKPQFINAYEVGLKSELLDRRLRLNLAYYHYDIDDYQIRSAAVATPGSSVVLNAAQVKVDGFDAEFEAAPTDRVRLFGGFTWLNSRFSKFGGLNSNGTPLPLQAPFVYPNYSVAPTGGICPASLQGTANPGQIGTGTNLGGWTTCLGNATGLRTPNAPKFTASIGGSYTVPLGDESEVRLSALYSYNSGYVFEPDNLIKQPSYSLLNAGVEYRINENFGVEVWGRNLTDTHWFQQKISTATGTTAVPAAPRTYGINFKFDY